MRQGKYRGNTEETQGKYIVRVAVWYNMESGGAKRALYYHVRGLVERGHEVEVWCPQTADRDYLPLSGLVPEHALPLDPPEVSGARGKVAFRYERMKASIAAMDRHCQACAEEIHRGGFDALFANTCLEFGAAAIGRWVNLPSGLYLQEPHRPLYEAMPELPWLAPSPRTVGRSPRRQAEAVMGRWRDQVHNSAARLKARQELSNAQAYKAIWVNSYFSRESVLRAYGLDSQVCYLGIDTDLFCDLNLPRKDFVIGLGVMAAHKNVRSVIEALGLLPAPRPPLVWVGNESVPGYLAEMQALAAARGVEMEVRRRVSNEELLHLLNSARLMAYAPRLEPFGFAPLEANACGLPVVAAAEGGVRETVQDGVNGLLVEPTPQAMADGIQRLCDDPALARQIGARGRQVVAERWSLAVALDRMEQCLLSLADRQKSPAIRH